MRMTPRGCVFGLLSFLSFFVFATAQYAFTTPDPTLFDFDSRNDITQDDVVEFAWVLNSTVQETISGDPILDDDGNISLWLTSFHGLVFARCLATSVNSESGGTWGWKVSLTDEEIDSGSGQFVYRLKPPVVSKDQPYDEDSPEAPSRGFRILKESDPSPTSSTTAPTSSSLPPTSAAPSTTPTDAASDNDDSSSDNSNSDGNGNGNGLSAGAKGGIGAGVAVGGIILIGGAFFLWRHYRGRPQHLSSAVAPSAQPLPLPQTAGMGAFPPPPPSELSGFPSERSGLPSELDSGPDSTRAMAELGPGEKRV